MATDRIEADAACRKLRRRLFTRLPLLGRWLRQQAVADLAQNGSAPAVHILADAAASHEDATLRSHALDELMRLARQGNEAAGEALCLLVIEEEQPEAQGFLVHNDIVPQAAEDRALFLFLTEQWDAYEGLDFDHQLLRSAYTGADARLRRRIASAASRAGRMEWLALVSAGSRGRPLGAMSECEWRTTVRILERRRRWADAWQLAQEAPPRWSAPIMRVLGRSGWLPPPSERAGFQLLVALAEDWPEDNLDNYLDCVATWQAHPDEVRCLAVDARGHRLASGGGDGSVCLWRLPDGSALAELTGHCRGVQSVAFVRDVLASAGRDGTVRLWSIDESHDCVAIEGHEGAIQCMGVAPDHRLLVTGGADGQIWLWDVRKKEPLRSLKQHREAIVCLAVSPNGDVLASGAADATVRLWSLPEGRLLHTLTAHRAEQLDAVLCLAISPNGTRLASGGSDGTVRLWTLPGGDALETLRAHQRSVTSLAFSPDGSLLVSGGADGQVRLGRAPDGAEERRLCCHTGEITSLLINAEGRLLFTASGNGTDRGVRVWTLPEGNVMKGLYGHDRSVRCLAYEPRGRTVVTGGGEGTIRLWRAELARLAATAPAESKLADLEWVERRLAGAAEDVERNALEYIAALFRWRRRHDVIVEAAAPRRLDMGEFDIEIGG